MNNIDSIVFGTGMPEHFWAVTKPSDAWDHDFLASYLVISDICFRTDYRTLMVQSLGGLKPRELLGVFADEEEAKQYAAIVVTNAGANRKNAQG